MGMGFDPTWLRQVSPPLLHKTTLTTDYRASVCSTSITPLLFSGSAGVGRCSGLPRPQLAVYNSIHFSQFVLIIVGYFSCVHKFVYPAWAVTVVNAATLPFCPAHIT